MKKYLEYLKESLELSGKNSFFNFLQIIGNHNYHFVYSDYYTEAYQYLYFFVTESIKNNEEFTEVFQYKTSLASCNAVLTKLGHNQVSFFFGINNESILRYGILDNLSKKSHVCGEFKVNDKYFDSVKKYKAISHVHKYLDDINIKNITLMRKIKNELETFYKSKTCKKSEIRGKNTVVSIFDRHKFSDEEIRMNRPFRVLHEWVLQKDWASKVHYYVNELENELEFTVVVH